MSYYNPRIYNKIYNKGKLIGVITDKAYLDSLIFDKYKDYEEEFPNTQLGLGEDVYVVEEKSYANFANADDQIMDYLVENDWNSPRKKASMRSSTSRATTILPRHWNSFIPTSSPRRPFRNWPEVRRSNRQANWAALKPMSS